MVVLEIVNEAMVVNITLGYNVVGRSFEIIRFIMNTKRYGAIRFTSSACLTNDLFILKYKFLIINTVLCVETDKL